MKILNELKLIYSLKLKWCRLKSSPLILYDSAFVAQERLRVVDASDRHLNNGAISSIDEQLFVSYTLSITEVNFRL